MKILLDTNFLVAPFQFSFDVYDELERLYPYADLYTLDAAVHEAKSIESGRYGDLVEEMLEHQDVEVMETEGEGNVDDLVADLSGEFTVATNDRQLKRRIKQRGNPVVIVRSGNHVEVENDPSV
jgi:hypothetical protein